MKEKSTEELINLYDKPPQPGLILLRCIGNADPRKDLYRGGLKGIGLQPDKVGIDKRDTVEFGAYREGLRKSSGADGAFYSADKDGLGAFCRAGYDIQHVMDTIAEIDVGYSALMVHDLGASRSAVMGVTGGVLLAQIAFGFGYATTDYRAVMLTHTENLAADGLCGAESILKIEIPAEYQFLASSAGM